MRVQRLLTLLAGTLVSAAIVSCDQTPEVVMSAPHPTALRAPRVDVHFRLADAERERIIRGYDPDALERLLARITPERRSEILSYFQIPSPEDHSRTRGQLIGLNEPELQPLLDEVWAPMWDEVKATDADIAADVFQFPGREIAARRRADRNQAPAQPE